MNQFLINVLLVSPDTITWTVIVACLLLFVLPLMSSPLLQRLRNVSPGLMISVGILGTFWGTLLALNGFNTSASGSEQATLDYSGMVQSIPNVIGGMKTAFITSLIGLFAAVTAKILYAYIPEKTANNPLLPVEEKTLALLQDINKSLNDLNVQSSASLEKIDGSVKKMSEQVTHSLQKLGVKTDDSFLKLDQINQHMAGLSDAIRESLVKNIDELVKEIRTSIAEQLVKQIEGTNKVLDQQLREMTKRIERALIDEFGQTFKEFNAATHAIKDWQIEHKEQVKRLTESFETSATKIGEIRADCERIPHSMAELRKTLGELDQRLKAFATMKEQAVSTFPAMKKSLDGLNKIVMELGKTASVLNNATKEMDTLAKTYPKQINDVVEQITKEWGGQVAGIAAHVADALKKGGRSR